MMRLIQQNSCVTSAFFKQLYLNLQKGRNLNALKQIKKDVIVQSDLNE